MKMKPVAASFSVHDNVFKIRGGKHLDMAVLGHD